MTFETSTVKWFDVKKGYGFIHHPNGGDDVFVHYTHIESDAEFKTLRTGQTVRFEMENGPKGLHALQVVVMDEETDAEPMIGHSDLDRRTSHQESVRDAYIK